MNYFNRNKWTAIAFLVLVLLNIGTLATFWFMRTNDRGPQQMASIDFLVKELGFNSSQKRQLQELVMEHRRQMRDIRMRTREDKDAFFALLKNNNLPDSVLEMAAMRSVENEKREDMLTFHHFRQVRNLCNDVQKIKFDDIIRDVIHMNAPPPERLPRNGPEGPPPPGNGIPLQ